MALTVRSAPAYSIGLPRLPRLGLRELALAFAGIFLLLTVDAIVQERAFFDLGLLRAIQRLDLPYLEAVLHPVDRLTSGLGAIAAWTLVLVAFTASRWWLPALTMLALPAGGVINEAIGRFIANHVRPDAADVQRVIGETNAPSFPSGHVLGAVLLYGFLYVVADRFENRWLRAAIKTAAVAVIAITGVARLWYGAHWPTDVLGAYALGGLLLVGIVAAYRRIDAAVGHLPFIRAAVPAHDEHVPHAHALTSLVLFHGDTVAKVYAPGFLPRAIYWLAFQAPFPYIRNLAALRAAQARRNLAALLSEYWYGTSRVARITGIDPVAGGSGYALTSEFVTGQAPSNRAGAKAFLTDLRGKFEQAGLPTWQIDPRQPRAVDNVLETADGRYMIVDLESGLVAPIASRKTWARAIRRGLVPMYDDVFFDITRAYIEREAAGLRAALGEDKVAELIATLDAAEASALTWHRGEPRLWSKLARGIMTGFGIRSWPAWLRAKLSGSQEQAQAWIGRAVDTWEAEGRVTAAEAAQMRVHMNGAEFQAMLPHLGAHIIISIPLRFPFGSIARAAWSAGVLAVATGRLLARRISRRQWQQAWSIHSPLVILLSAVPGFGTFAYLAAKPVRSNRLLLRATGDAALTKVPFQLYRRSGLPRLIARPAAVAVDPTETGPAGIATPTPRQVQAPRPIRVTTTRPLPLSHTSQRGGAGRLVEPAAAAGEVR